MQRLNLVLKNYQTSNRTVKELKCGPSDYLKITQFTSNRTVKELKYYWLNTFVMMRNSSNRTVKELKQYL